MIRTFPWKVVITIGLAAVLLYAAFRNVDWNTMLDTVRQGQPQYLLAAFAMVAVNYTLRSRRWRVLLSARHNLNGLDVFWATCVGYLGNSYLPARAGEVMRSVFLGRKARINEGFVLATVLVDRILDAALLASFMLLLITEIEQIPDWVVPTTRVVAIMCLVSIAGLVMVPRFQGFFNGMLDRLPLPEQISARLHDLMTQVFFGLQAFQHPGRGLGFIAYSALVWITEVVIYWLVGMAFGLTLTVPQILLLLGALGLSSAVPSTPGFVGIYQFIAATILPPFGYTEAQALVYILAVQAVMYAAVSVWGGIGLWQLNQSTSAVVTADVIES